LGGAAVLNASAMKGVAEVEETSESDVPQLLAMVQATCLSLADRLKENKSSRSGAGCSGNGSEPAPRASTVIAAAKAARDLLAEVEMAFLEGSPRPSFCEAAQGYGLDAAQNSKNLTQWFNMCTPGGDSRRSSYSRDDPEGACSVSSLANAPNLRSSPRTQRHSCPPVPDETLSSQITSPATRGTPRSLLGDWIHELRRVDPWPLLRPPHVTAPQSPRPDGATLTARLESLQESPCKEA